ncbi:predicted protein [Postia placenta Mad-698-R]|uniref:Ribosome assembly protein 3 n=1 Tax=Postia placenta MAD-698-R-SB12 TaxID=670580 RepID=A0A1X6NB69_9APHY|nr:hypothetical protein POSPLADRAFT_1130914 [Postia placenta MAD-698-R-SB12]EED77329.1 predicted protein [Postia placenta Mad-698-R]EED82057.1 predicted protein [Postia placenta Mad-698-R]OSX65752.1 hypothetical protein POSPLADRAFT_1130914 [Postia placenta MAD-698-R-SB12]
MAGQPTRPVIPRKRNRRRNRRAASSSSSSDSSSDSDSDAQPPKKPAPTPARLPIQEPSSSSDESSSDSDSSSDNESVARPPSAPHADAGQRRGAGPNAPAKRAPSPARAVSAIPAFPSDGASEQEKQDEQVLRDRFRKFWMTSVADAFKDDLEEIRKEPNLTTSRLTLLIDSLASGADVFTSSRGASGNDVNEMEVVLDHTSQ